MPDIKVTTRITASQFRNISAEYALDLEAVYSFFQFEILNILNEADENNWDMEKIINEIETLVGKD